jgi:hypothetical protein
MDKDTMNGNRMPDPPVAAARWQVDAAATCEVLYMGIPHPVAKRVGTLWYHETPDDYKPFALQGRVGPIVRAQRGPK